jgi:hypothetical protein
LHDDLGGNSSAAIKFMRRFGSADVMQAG